MMDAMQEGRGSLRKSISLPSGEAKSGKKKSEKRRKKSRRTREDSPPRSDDDDDMCLMGNQVRGKKSSSDNIAPTSTKSAPVHKSPEKKSSGSMKGTRKLPASSSNSETTVTSSSTSTSTLFSASQMRLLNEPTPKPIVNETVRWANALKDEEAEAERIRRYKLNRCKRYLVAKNIKYEDWVKQGPYG